MSRGASLAEPRARKVGGCKRISRCSRHRQHNRVAMQLGVSILNLGLLVCMDYLMAVVVLYCCFWPTRIRRGLVIYPKRCLQRTVVASWMRYTIPHSFKFLAVAINFSAHAIAIPRLLRCLRSSFSAYAGHRSSCGMLLRSQLCLFSVCCRQRSLHTVLQSGADFYLL